MAKLRADNDDLQWELESMKENIAALKPQVTAALTAALTAAPILQGTRSSYSRVPPDLSVISIYNVT